MPDFPLILIFNRILIPCLMKGPRWSLPVATILDTGIAMPVIAKDKVFKLGFEPDKSERAIPLETAGGLIMGQIITVPKLYFLGYILSDIDMVCVNTSVSELGAEARLGMDFIKRFDIELNFSTETLRVNKINT